MEISEDKSMAKKGRYSGIGGQAVLEGIMMKNKEKYKLSDIM